MAAKKAPAIGIDLGTTYSCVAVWQNGRVEIIPNESGSRTTPSYVGFTRTERLIGDAAKNKVAINAKNTIFDAKRLIGSKVGDKNVQELMKHWPFKVVGDHGGNPKFEVEYKGEVKQFTPEEISSMVLVKMKETAEAYLGSEVTDAVITVPAYFNDSQRQATKDAGVIAGLNVLRIINEPTAAALAYGLDKKLQGKGNKNVLVFDLGGGTFDVSVLTIDQGSLFEVKSSAGDNHLGGEDFDNRLVDFIINDFKSEHRKDMSGNTRAVRRLRTACEQAKRTLSSCTETHIVVESMHADKDLDMPFSRADFEELCFPLFKKIMDPVEAALKDAKLDKSAIDEVVLVGGSTRIPKIQKLLQDFFNGKELNKSVNPDEAVAHGAAILAATLSGDSMEAVPVVSLVDVIPFSLGIRTVGGYMATVMKRNTIIPSMRSKLFFTSVDNQTEIEFEVFEGERTMTKDNRFLGVFTLEGILPAPAEEAKVDVTFEIDCNSILHVTAKETKTGNHNGITIKTNKGRLSAEEIDRMVADAKKYKADDKKQVENAAARNQLKDYISGMKQDSEGASSRDKSDFWRSFKHIVAEKHAEILKWLKGNPNANKEECEKKFKQVQKELQPVILKLKQSRDREVAQKPGDSERAQRSGEPSKKRTRNK